MDWMADHWALMIVPAVLVGSALGYVLSFVAAYVVTKLGF